jgi:hypothetical protein
MSGDVRRVESKLRAVLAQADCPLCRDRLGRCPQCGHPVGSLASDGRLAAAALENKLNKMVERMRLWQDPKPDLSPGTDAPGTGR